MPTPNLYATAGAEPFEALAPEYRSNGVDLLFATDRAPGDDEGAGFKYGFGRSLSLAFGSAVVRLGEDVSWEALKAVSRRAERVRSLPLSLDEPTELGRFPPTPYPFTYAKGQVQEDPAILDAFRRTKEVFRAELDRRLALTPRKSVLIYVHGYNNSFADAAFTLAEIWHFAGREGVPLLYTWPAGRGGLTGYAYDRESGQFTVFHLKQLLRTLASFPQVEQIQILAHSRGTDVVTTALRELFIETRANGQEPRDRFRIANLILAAPDLDGQVLSQRIVAERLGPGVGQATVYTSQGDKAIGVAELLFGSLLRVGRATEGTLPPIASEIMKQGVNVEFVEFRGKGGIFGHGYWHSDPAASSDLIMILRYQRDAGADHGRPLKPAGPGMWVIPEGYPESF
jgi:esterase/lipase superfamily enzyme